MAKVTPIIMVRSLNIQRGGVTKAAMKKANLLAEKHKVVIICTFVYQRQYKKIIQELYDHKSLANNIKVINFFEDMKPNKKASNKHKNKKAQYVKEKGLTEFLVPDNDEPSYRYYQSGLFTKYKRYDEDQNLKFIDYFDSNRHRLRREEYDEKGFITRISHMDINKNKSRLDRYFDYKGNCYLSVRINPKTQKEGITAQFTDNANIEYPTLRDCQEAWFNDILNDIKYPIASSELRGLDSFLINAKHENLKKIAVNHTSHLQSPFDKINEIKPANKTLYNNAEKLDQLVFLTEEQKADVEKIFGNHNNFTVIPHSYKLNQRHENSKSQNSFNPKLAVTLARYNPDKRLNEAIKAFSHVVDKIPEAQYHIYGYGPIEKDLQSLIKQLNLEKNVFLKEYTLNPESVYRLAACSILTSRQEAFAMVITESMSVGTPVVSYNIKYGPNDIINDGINGFLVENGDKHGLAERVIEIMQNEKLREQLSNNARAIKEKFSEKKYREQWLNLYRS